VAIMRASSAAHWDGSPPTATVISQISRPNEPGS